jgi:hypothetical protein
MLHIKAVKKKIKTNISYSITPHPENRAINGKCGQITHSQTGHTL